MLYLFPILTPLTLALRNMRTRLGRTVLTLVGIVLGVAVVLAIQITNQSTLDSIRQVFDRAAGQADLLVVPAGATGDGITPDLLAELEVLDGVQVAAPAVMAQTWLAAEADSWQIAFTASGTAAGNVLQLYGIDPTVDQQVRVYELSGGRMPYPEEYEAILPASFAAEKDLSIGDDLVILTPLGNERLEIVGLLADQGVALLNGGVVAFAPLPVVQELFALGDEVAEVSLRTEAEISTAPKALQAFKEQLEAQLPQDSRAVYPAARGQLVSRMLATYQQGLSFFSMIAIFVGAFLIYNTFSMTIVERTREIGMLRAIGMSRRKVISMVLAEALFLALIGSLIGLAAGVVLARGLMTMTGAIVDTGEQAFTISRQGIVQSLLVGLGVTLGAALLPAIQAARTSPLTALRVRARSGEHIRPTVWLAGLTLIFVGWAMLYKLEWRPAAQFPMGSSAILLILLGATLTVPLVVVLLERATRPLATILYGNEGRIGTSNVRRSVGRTTLTVASLMVALAMVIGIGSLAHAFEQDMASWVETALGGDLYVRSPLVMRTSFGRQLENLPGVAAVSAARYINVRVAPEEIPADSPEDDTMIFIAIDPNTFRQVGEMEFAIGQGDPEANWARLSQGNALFISTVVAERFNLAQGDTLHLLTRRGEQAFLVAAVVVDFTGQGYTINGTYQDLQRWFGESGADRFTIKVTPQASVQSVSAEIEDRYQARRFISVQTTAALKADINGLMDQSFQLFDVLNLIGVVIGALGVTNTLTMNVMERQREIGGLRSLGMTRHQVLRMILAEALALGSMGAIYGLVFGYVMAQILVWAMNLMNGYELVYVFTAQPFVLGVLIAFGVAQGAALLPARRAARVNIVEAIKHE